MKIVRFLSYDSIAVGSEGHIVSYTKKGLYYCLLILNSLFVLYLPMSAIRASSDEARMAIPVSVSQNVWRKVIQ